MSTFILAVLQAWQGILVAYTIQDYGFLTRLVLGALGICGISLLEMFVFKEVLSLKEAFAIIIVLLSSYQYYCSKPINSSSNECSLFGEEEDPEDGNYTTQNRLRGQSKEWEGHQRESSYIKEDIPSVLKSLVGTGQAKGSYGLRGMITCLLCALGGGMVVVFLKSGHMEPCHITPSSFLAEVPYASPTEITVSIDVRTNVLHGTFVIRYPTTPVLKDHLIEQKNDDRIFIRHSTFLGAVP